MSTYQQRYRSRYPADNVQKIVHPGIMIYGAKKTIQITI